VLPTSLFDRYFFLESIAYICKLFDTATTDHSTPLSRLFSNLVALPYQQTCLKLPSDRPSLVRTPHHMLLLQSVLTKPGDSKSTAEKLAGDAAGKAQAVGQNVLDTGAHYADKAQKSDAGQQATSTASAVADNVSTTAQHYADKAADNAPTTQDSSKTYLEQAQDLAAGALNTASKAASGMLFSTLLMCHC
jgi:hypothetical protein